MMDDESRDRSYETVGYEYLASQVARLHELVRLLTERVARLEVARHGYPPTDSQEGTEL